MTSGWSGLRLLRPDDGHELSACTEGWNRRATPIHKFEVHELLVTVRRMKCTNDMKRSNGASNMHIVPLSPEGIPMAQSPYDVDLERNAANFQPLTPLSFLERAASVFPDHTAIIHGP